MQTLDFDGKEAKIATEEEAFWLNVVELTEEDNKKLEETRKKIEDSIKINQAIIDMAQAKADAAA